MKNHSPTKPLRWGILGYGRHADKAMVPALAESPSAQLVAIATSSEAKASRLIAQNPELSVYTNYHQLLEDDSVDAIYIGLPNHLHFQWTKLALEYNKHVLCDKPITLTAAEAEQLSQVQSSAKYMEAFMYRFHPQHSEVLRLISSGAIGKVRLFEAHFHFLMDDPQNIRFRPECGGGGLLDVGCYVVDSARFILGAEPSHVSAVWHIGETGVDEFASFQLRFPGGVAANLTCGCKFGWTNQYCVYGTSGKITLAPAYTIPRNKPGKIILEPEKQNPEIIKVPAANQYALEIEGFTAWILGEQVDRRLFGNGIENMKILDGVRKAATTGAMVEI